MSFKSDPGSNEERVFAWAELYVEQVGSMPSVLRLIAASANSKAGIVDRLFP
jgi:hypothetical protein